MRRRRFFHDPEGTQRVSLPAGASIAYKFVRMDSSGAVTWESGANRTATIAHSDTTLSSTWT
jgi:alpha-amylase